MELIDYLSESFFTEQQLLARGGIDLARLRDWQTRRLMPQASYRLRLTVDCESVFGPHSAEGQLRYYAKAYVDWIAELLASEEEVCERFCARYRQRLIERGAQGLRTGASQFNAGLEQHLVQEWSAFLHGTYGLCARAGLPEDIADKELSSAIVKETIEGEQVLTVAERERLRVAVDLLDRSCAPFAPHERARSSRRRLVDEVRATHLA